MNKNFARKIKLMIFVLLILIVAGLYLYKPAKEKVIFLSINSFSFINNIFNKVDNAQDIESIKSENIFLQDQIKTLTKENQKISSELGLRVEGESRKVPLQLLSSRSSLYNSIYVKSDKSLNLYSGMYVYGADNLVIGLIDEVYEKYSKVSFLGQKAKFSAELLNSGEIIELSTSGVGLYYGKLPKSVSLENGETVVMRGYPKAMVGNITQIEEDNTSLNTVWVRSPINILKRDIYYVSIE
jgi:cell shape-determining protein MreC